MDISQYTAQSLVRPRDGQGDGQAGTPSGTRIRALGPAAEAPAISTQQKGAQDAQETGLFDTVLDTINPLQHLPGVSTAYQAATGDTSSPLADMAGGFLFGGPVGLMAGAAKSFLELVTGKSLTEHATALFSDDNDSRGASNDVEIADTVQRDSILSAQAPAGLSVQHYQAFANAAETRHQGIGARSNEVSWADTLWTQRALKQATGLYEDSQQLGGDARRRARII